jgi:hypothetical protein
MPWMSTVVHRHGFTTDVASKTRDMDLSYQFPDDCGADDELLNLEKCPSSFSPPPQRRACLLPLFLAL